MKKTALLAAVAALFVATPAMAQSGGSIGLTYGNTEVDDDDADTISVDVAVGGVGGNIGYQFDGAIGSTSGDSDDATSFTLAGHLYWQGSGWRLGGVAAHTSFDDDDSVSETSFGVEGSFDLGSAAVLTGAYTVGETEFLIDVDTWNADLGIDFYLSDNLRIGGNFGTGNLDFGGGDVDTSTLGIDAEWQPWTHPVSFRIAYESFDVDDLFDDNISTISLGARWNWGGTLRERDNATPFDTQTALYQRLFALQ